MDKHPIGELMETTMAKIKEMVDVNVIVGAPITTVDGITLIPVSKVGFGFASGGSDFASKNQRPEKDNAFGGGAGAGVKISPVAFLVVRDGNVRVINIAPPADNAMGKLIDLAPELIDKIKDIVNNGR